MKQLEQVMLLALDVDGTLTDGGIYFDSQGNESKRFHIQDGLGIVLARLAGLKVAWITGRRSAIVERRAGELGVDYLRQGVKDKAAVLREVASEAGVSLDQVAYMGDDWNDAPAFQLAAVRIAPANAASEIRALAHFITPRSGGEGAVRDAIETLLRAQNRYQQALERYLE